MISGAHMIPYSSDAEKDRAFLRDVHPTAQATNGRHEIYLMCEDVQVVTAKLARHGIACSAVTDQGWGLLTELTLPGGGKLGLYQPKQDRLLARAAQNRRYMV